MRENKIGKVLSGIGIFIIAIGFLFFILLTLLLLNAYFLIGVAISFISGMCFIGLAEIINLLQTNLYKQELIIASIKTQTLENKLNSLKSSASESK